MWLNGVVGVRQGVGFPVQLRPAFGFRGTHIPVIMRGISGLVWFGVEAWAGSLAIRMIVVSLTGVSKDMVTAVAIKYLVIALVAYLGSFVLVMLFGLQGIGQMANWAGPFMLVYFVWLVVWLLTRGEFKPNISHLWVSKAGYLSIPFLLYLAVQTNWWATVALNISDISRGVNPAKKGSFGIGLFVGIVLCQMLGTALGYSAVALTGTILPQDIIVKYSPGVIPALIGLLFAFLAPWSTDMTANSIPLFNISMSTFKLRWKPAVIIGSIIAFFAVPWWKVETGQQYIDYIQGWAGNYGILLGPIAGLMIANYWLVRSKKLDIGGLYTKGSGPYWFRNGWSISAYVSLVLTWVLCYVIAILLEWFFAGVFKENK